MSVSIDVCVYYCSTYYKTVRVSGGEGDSGGHVRVCDLSMCVFITAVPITKLFAWGEGDSGGHVLPETTSRGLCGLVVVVYYCST
jgi:hypothetical protein